MATSSDPSRDGAGDAAGRSRSAARRAAGGYKRSIVVTLILVVGLGFLVSQNPWSLSAALIVACGVYVAFEFSLVKIPVSRLERDVDAGVRGAAILLEMKQDMNALLAAAQLGITLTSLGLTLALEPAIHHAFQDIEWVAAYSVGIAMAFGTILHVTFGELIPKGLALVVPAKVLYFTAPFMRIFRVLAVPFIKTCNAVANVVVQGLTGKNPEVAAHHEEGVDIERALVYAHAAGEIKRQQLKLMRNVLQFADRTVRSAMTPARRVICLDLKREWMENVRTADEHGYSRFPVIDGNPHDVAGYVRRADILQSELKGERDLRKIMLPIERRPETATLARLDLFRGCPMIAAYDEYDTFTGLLTAEDLVEQIVGEIYDETDDRDPRPDVEPLPGGGWRVAGEVLLERVADVLGVAELAEPEDVDTIGGLVTKLLGRQPRAGDEVLVEGYAARVEGAQGFRVTWLTFKPRLEEPAEAEEAPAADEAMP